MSAGIVDVAIIGGGIAGLSAAWFLQEEARAAGQPGCYVLLESSGRWGGKIQTETVNGYGDAPFVVESGPDSFITTKPWAWQLSRKLGMDAEFLPTNDDRRQTYVLKNGRATPLPDGVMLIVPTEFKPFVLTRLISPLGKLRMGLELLIPPRTDGQDETLADFIRRRLGAEALDRIAEPLLSGIYNADAEKQSVLATFPRFRDLEVEYGSITRGMLAGRKARAAAANGRSESSDRPKPPSAFMSFGPGMGALVERLLEDLDGELRLNTAVLQIKRAPHDDHYEIVLEDDTVCAHKIILAVPAYVAADLLDGLAPQAAQELRAIRYVSTGTISLAYRRDEFEHPLDGFGIVIPRSEQRDINAITWSSTKFDQRAPDGYVLLRVFFGGSRTPHMMDKSDSELERIVRGELQALMGVRAEPILRRIYRWPQANPQYDVFHLERVAAIEAALPPGLVVTGSPYRGIGVPDCVHQAEDAVKKLVAGEKQLANAYSLNLVA
jgi:oxygen-dependent protoporphyrinogen oxidase